MVGSEVLAAVRAGVTVVSIGRGTVIDEASMIAALAAGQIGFAVLDVFAAEPLASDSPLWRDPNVLISPHTAALNPAEDRLIAELFARERHAVPQRRRTDQSGRYCRVLLIVRVCSAG